MTRRRSGGSQATAPRRKRKKGPTRRKKPRTSMGPLRSVADITNKRNNVYFYDERAQGQNKSKVVMKFFAMLSVVFPYKKVVLCFLLPGHSHIIADRVIAWCRRATRKKNLHAPLLLVEEVNKEFLAYYPAVPEPIVNAPQLDSTINDTDVPAPSNEKRKPGRPEKKKKTLKSKQPSILQFFNLAQRPSS
ncbi:uncharacterized protein PITG_13797 [Phytophthora infestans T30-4]|uniref:DUF7869 domain-containing protein n=1 Tax=Phytophthora infestans (strain T30-4) TaxID=403677 RepID=D0NMU0_PHYIT|nr:uncharacterized protein PITG_13797 [Phytophthora infestans T30-4]EEY61847.1 conserved hypothetical protein [Phytophthora infestans T30-4]|eukprot:XP_002899487.1 conserved hypothetical protein [Phytophthora infestans T30-4]